MFVYFKLEISLQLMILIKLVYVFDMSTNNKILLLIFNCFLLLIQGQKHIEKPQIESYKKIFGFNRCLL